MSSASPTRGAQEEDNEEEEEEEEDEEAQVDTLLLTKEHVKHMLWSRDPGAVSRELQQEHALREPLGLCALGLPLLDELRIQRGDVMQQLLSMLKATLEEMVPGLPQEVLSRLLDRTVRYLATDELKEIPLQIMNHVRQPPSSVLQILAGVDKHSEAELPLHIKQQIWEHFPDKFHATMRVLVHRYTSVDRIVAEACETLDPLPATHTRPHNHPHHVQQQQQQQQHRRKPIPPTVRLIATYIGTSKQLFLEFVGLLRRDFDQKQNERLCTLRRDIVLMLRDLKSSVHQADPAMLLAFYTSRFIDQVRNNDKRFVETLHTIAETVQRIGRDAYASSSSSASSTSRNSNSPAPSTPSSGNGQPQSSLPAPTPAPPPQPKPPPARNDALRAALNKLKKKDKGRLFLLPVVEQYPLLRDTYLKVVTKPMDLTTMEGKIDNGEYHSFDEFKEDVRLMCDNCERFNQASNPKHVEKARSLLAYGLKLVAEQEAAFVRAVERYEASVAAASSSGAATTDGSSATSMSPANGASANRSAIAPAQKQPQSQQQQQQSSRSTPLLRIAGPLLLADAAMVLADRHFVNALVAALWKVIHQEVVLHELLPRKVPTVREVAYILRVGLAANSLVADALAQSQTVHFPSADLVADEKNPTAFRALLERSVAPVMASLSLDTRSAEPDPVPDVLRDWCTRHAIARHVVFHLLWASVHSVNEAMVDRLLELTDHLGPKLVGWSASLLRSLVAALDEPRRQQPTLPSNRNLRLKIIARVFVPAVLEAADTNTPLATVHSVHYHLARLLHSPSSYDDLARAEVLSLLRPVVLSLGTASLVGSEDAAGQQLAKLVRARVQVEPAATASQRDQVEFHVPGLTEQDMASLARSEAIANAIKARYNERDFVMPRRHYDGIMAMYNIPREVLGLPPVAAAHPANYASSMSSPSFSPGAYPTPGLTPGASPSPSPAPYSTSPSASPSPSPMDASPAPFPSPTPSPYVSPPPQ